MALIHVNYKMKNKDFNLVFIGELNHIRFAATAWMRWVPAIRHIVPNVVKVDLRKLDWIIGKKKQLRLGLQFNLLQFSIQRKGKIIVKKCHVSTSLRFTRLVIWQFRCCYDRSPT